MGVLSFVGELQRQGLEKRQAELDRQQRLAEIEANRQARLSEIGATTEGRIAEQKAISEETARQANIQAVYKQKSLINALRDSGILPAGMTPEQAYARVIATPSWQESTAAEKAAAENVGGTPGAGALGASQTKAGTDRNTLTSAIANVGIKRAAGEAPYAETGGKTSALSQIAGDVANLTGNQNVAARNAGAAPYQSDLAETSAQREIGQNIAGTTQAAVANETALGQKPFAQTVGASDSISKVGANAANEAENFNRFTSATSAAPYAAETGIAGALEGLERSRLGRTVSQISREHARPLMDAQAAKEIADASVSAQSGGALAPGYAGNVIGNPMVPPSIMESLLPIITSALKDAAGSTNAPPTRPGVLFNLNSLRTPTIPSH